MSDNWQIFWIAFIISGGMAPAVGLFFLLIKFIIWLFNPKEKLTDWGKFNGIECQSINNNIEEIYRKK